MSSRDSQQALKELVSKFKPGRDKKRSVDFSYVIRNDDRDHWTDTPRDKSEWKRNKEELEDINKGLLNKDDISWLEEKYKEVFEITDLMINANLYNFEKDEEIFYDSLRKLREALKSIINSEPVFQNAGIKHLQWIENVANDETLMRSLRNKDIGASGVYDSLSRIFYNYIYNNSQNLRE